MGEMGVKFLFIFITVLIGQQVFCSEEPRANIQDFAQGPFFWQKPKVQEKMHASERAVPVSVLYEVQKPANAEKFEVWTMKGAGIVRTDCQYALSKALDFANLQKLNQYFTEVSWNADKTELQLTIKILSRQQKMKVQIRRAEKALATDKTTDQKADEKERRLQFQVLSGAFQGGEGVLLFKNATQRTCEVGLVSVYQGQLIGFARDVFAIAVESLLQFVAKSMRTKIEQAYSAEQGKV